MLALILATALSGANFDNPEVWALALAPPPRLGFVGDVDGDGRADVISVNPRGACSIDVSLTTEGVKPGPPITAIDHWGTDCQCAAVATISGDNTASVIGLFAGSELRRAANFKGGHFTDVPKWATLPKPLRTPCLASLEGGKRLLAFSTRDGDGYLLNTRSMAVTACQVPRGLVWIGDAGEQFAAETTKGVVEWLDKATLKPGGRLGQIDPQSRPAASGGLVAFGDKVWTPAGVESLSAEPFPSAAESLAIGPITGDLPDILAFRDGKEAHTGNEVVLRREAANGPQLDSSNDGLLDDWKLRGYRGLDLKALGCKPGHADVICLISRFANVKEDLVKSQVEKIVKFYAALKVKNPDGTIGVNFHPIFLDPIPADNKDPWWVNRDKYRPAKWRGVVHWMQITPGGGGQADELGDGGGCGQGALWAVFIHEFGHQLGLPHTGFWPVDFCPIYTSLMNYNYSYGFDDSINNVHYSDGSLSKIVLHENDLDEVLPYPYEKVKFLEKGPYHYHLRPDGAQTLIDWNWNGIFGEHHVRANINYAYAINGGLRHEMGKTETAPWLLTHNGTPCLLYGERDFKMDPKVDPTIDADRPGRLMMRIMRKEEDWASPMTIESGGLIGDPVAASYAGHIWAFYQTSAGVAMRRIDPSKGGLTMSAPVVIESDKTLVPTTGVYAGKLFLFLWHPTTGEETYKVMGKGGEVEAVGTLDAKSTGPVGLCEDTVTHQAIVGLCQDQDAKRLKRWQIRHYGLAGNKLVEDGDPEWVQGPDGNVSGTGRVTVIFEHDRDSGPQGRVAFFCLGNHGAESPWACEYMALQIADKTVHGGWLVKRYYDEWTQSRSSCTVTWYGQDLLYAYRWVDGGQGASDNNLQVSYEGMGISKLPFGDFDDIDFIRNFGLKNSLLYLNRS